VAGVLKILMFWHLMRVVPKLDVLLFTTEKKLSMKQADLRDIFKKS